jgi:hypothetical protein
LNSKNLNRKNIIIIINNIYVWGVSCIYCILPLPKNHNLEAEFRATIFLKSFLNNFPAALLGKELTNTIRLIFLYGATCNQEEKKMVHFNKQNIDYFINWINFMLYRLLLLRELEGTCFATKSIISASLRQL